MALDLAGNLHALGLLVMYAMPGTAPQKNLGGEGGTKTVKPFMTFMTWKHWKKVLKYSYNKSI